MVSPLDVANGCPMDMDGDRVRVAIANPWLGEGPLGCCWGWVCSGYILGLPHKNCGPDNVSIPEPPPVEVEPPPLNDDKEIDSLNWLNLDSGRE